jgi:hypothetical protein
VRALALVDEAGIAHVWTGVTRRTADGTVYVRCDTATVLLRRGWVAHFNARAHEIELTPSGVRVLAEATGTNEETR